MTSKLNFSSVSSSYLTRMRVFSTWPIEYSIVICKCDHFATRLHLFSSRLEQLAKQSWGKLQNLLFHHQPFQINITIIIGKTIHHSQYTTLPFIIEVYRQRTVTQKYSNKKKIVKKRNKLYHFNTHSKRKYTLVFSK